MPIVLISKKMMQFYCSNISNAEVFTVCILPVKGLSRVRLFTDSEKRNAARKSSSRAASCFQNHLNHYSITACSLI